MRLPIKHLQEELYRQQKQLDNWKEKDGQDRRVQLIDRVTCFKNAIDILSEELPLDELIFPKKFSEDGIVGLQRGLSALMVEGSSFEVEEVEGEIVIKSV
jgi:hypothetical protein